MLLPLLVSVVLSTPPGPTVSDVACQSVADCWLDADSRPIKRPKKFRGKAIPQGDCGSRLQWLRNKLECSQKLCTVTYVGDRC